MKYVSIRKSKTNNFVLSIIIVVLTIIFILKLIGIDNKVEGYHNAVNLVKNEQLLDAYFTFKSISKNKWIKYNEEDIQAQLENLSFVANIESSLKEFQDQASKLNNNTSEFSKLYEKYLQYINKTNDTDKHHKAALAHFDHESSTTMYFKSHLTELKEASIKDIEKNISNKVHAIEPFIELRYIPNEFFIETTKEDFIQTQLHLSMMTYLQHSFMNLNYQNFIKQMLDDHKVHNQHNFDIAFVIDEIENITLNKLKDYFDSSNISLFDSVASVYENNTILVDHDTTVLTYIDEAYKSWINKADALAQSNKFDEAIDLYQQLAPFVNTTKQIKQTMVSRAIKQPEYLLKETFGDLPSGKVVSIKDTFNSKVATALITNDHIYFVTMNEEAISSSYKYDIYITDNITSAYFESGWSPGNNPYLVLETTSNYDQPRYIAYSLDDNYVTEVLNVIGDSVTALNSTRLSIKNHIDYPDSQVYYDFDGYQYYLADVIPNYYDISVLELNYYKNDLVKFDATISYLNDYNNPIIFTGYSYIVLEGVYDYYSDYITVTGTFYAEDYVIEDELTYPVYFVQVDEYSFW